MNKWWQESHINRSAWILEHLNQLNLTAEETVVMLMIDLLTTHYREISPQVLSDKCHLSLEKIDDIITSLSTKNYLNLLVSPNGIQFNYDNIFNLDKEDKVAFSEMFALFEEEFSRPLSQPEMVMINQWIKKFPKYTIIDALRYASIMKKLNFNYINRILENNQHDNDDE